MICRIIDLRHKEVINSCTGTRIGFIDDVEIDTATSQIKSVIVYGRPRFMGILGRTEDFIVPWGDIQLIGEDTVLVTTNVKYKQKNSKKGKIFGQ